MLTRTRVVRATTGELEASAGRIKAELTRRGSGRAITSAFLSSRGRSIRVRSAWRPSRSWSTPPRARARRPGPLRGRRPRKAPPVASRSTGDLSPLPVTPCGWPGRPRGRPCPRPCRGKRIASRSRSQPRPSPVVPPIPRRFNSVPRVRKDATTGPRRPASVPLCVPDATARFPAS